MAGAGIQDDVRAPGSEIGAGSVCDPCVLADLKADAHPAEIEDEISYGHSSSVRGGEIIADAFRPWLEPAWLVVNAVSGEIPLCGEAGDLSVHDQCACIEKRPLVKDG